MIYNGIEYCVFEDETENQLIYRICSMKEKIGSWQDVCNILNNLLEYNYDESKYRKQYQSFCKMVEANEKNFVNDESILNAIKQERWELEQAKWALRTEKLEYNRWMREDARDILFEEKEINSIRENVVHRVIPNIPVKKNELGWQLNFSDCHYGKDFKVYGLMNEVINEYSPEIFEERMNKLLSEVIDKVQMFNINELHINNLGDSTEGFIRNSQIWTLRYGVIDSAIKFGNYIAEWLTKLSYYTNVIYNQTSGNHDELRLLDGRKNEHQCDRADKIIGNIIKIKNENNPNFTFKENKTGFIFDNIVGYNFLGIHGEVKNLSNAIKDYREIYGIDIDYIIAGHKHFNEYSNCGCRKGTIGVASIVGSDEFSMRIRKSADSSASLICYEKDKGKVADFTFILN